MKVILQDYINQTSEHCGSGSMRDLIRHYCGLDLPEHVVFGLGAGLDALYFPMPGNKPPFMFLGRGVSMEQDLAYTLGLDYQEVRQADNDVAWHEVRQEIIDGCPTMLAGDIFYLDYRKFKVHFPGHRFVLVGFDDEQKQVYIADRTECEPQVCSLQGVRDSRNSPVGMSSHNLWGKFHSGEVRHSLGEACEHALRITAARMLGDDRSQIEMLSAQAGSSDFVAGGLAALVLFRAQLKANDERHNDTKLAKSLVDNIVNFGTGGGFFRIMFAQFMQWSKSQRPDIVTEDDVQAAALAATHWADIANIAVALSTDANDLEAWAAIDGLLLQVENTERRLFEALAEQLHG
ncbi:MAG: BtrH N-terminal domain-containing protein [Pseudomonadales bacterium]